MYRGDPVRGIKNFHVKNVMSADDCQQKCIEDNDCQFWTWNSPQFRRKKNTCWLKAGRGEKMAKRGKTSGPRICK